MRASITRLESQTLLFIKGAARLIDGQEDRLVEMANEGRRLNALAAAANRRLGFEIIGHTDADGPDDANLPLSLARAEILHQAMGPTSLTHLDVGLTGAGSGRPIVESADEAGKQQNRRVAVRVIR